MESAIKPNSNSVSLPGTPATGTLEVLWTADERLTSPYRWKYFHRFDAASTTTPAFAALQGLDHARIIEQASRLGFTAVTKRQRDLHLRWIAQLDAISRTPVGGRPLREWLRFEGISLWHFIPELCYLGSAGPLQETIELIEYLTDLIVRFRPSRLVLAARWNDHQRATVSLISQRYEIPVECRPLEAPSSAIDEQPKKENRGDPLAPLEAGQPQAVREYVASLRRTRPAPAIGKNPVLLLSFPRAWTQTLDQGRIDVYYEAFRSFFQERGLSPIRVDVPYYFQIDGGVKNYIDYVLNGSSDHYPTVFLDEFGSDAIANFAQQCRAGLEQTFQGLIRNPEFLQAFSWRGINLVSPLVSFWQRAFVDHLALRCIPAMVMARRILDTIRPRAILAVYEVGIYARALILEAHRRGIPSLGLQHAVILPEHEYYLHDDIVHHPDLSNGCDGRIVSTKTLLFGTDAQRMLTQLGHYPLEATESIGCDWRHLRSSPENVACVPELKAKWSPSGRKIVLVLGQSSLTYGILHQLIRKLSPSEYSVLIKLHPDDKSGQAYRRLLEDHGFEVCLIRDYLREAIQAADLVFALVFSTAVLECLYWGKPVFALRDLDLPYSVPWERFTTDLASVDTVHVTQISSETRAELQGLLQTFGYDRTQTLRDFNLRMHTIFDEFEGKTVRNQAEPNVGPVGGTKSVGNPGECENDKVQSTTVPRPPREFQNELYRRLEINFDNYFRKSDSRCSGDTESSLIHRVQRVSFQLSNLCNYASIHTRCPLHGRTDKQVLPGRVVRDTIDELASIDFAGVIAFHIYNEPMIDPRLFSFIEYSRRVCPQGRVLILTNGFSLTQTIADELAELGIWNLAVSAYSPAEFDRLSRLQVKVPYKVFEARLDHRLDQYDRPPINLRKPCWAPIRDLSIGPDASVILCCLDWKQQHAFGNLMRETLSSILKKDTIRSAYRDLLGGNRNLHLCRRCDWVR